MRRKNKKKSIDEIEKYPVVYGKREYIRKNIGGIEGGKMLTMKGGWKIESRREEVEEKGHNYVMVE